MEINWANHGECGVRLGILRFGVIHKKVGPALNRSAKGIKNNLKIEAQSSRLKNWCQATVIRYYDILN
jgi:hypothetical protein